jgi:hypothetical protein
MRPRIALILLVPALALAACGGNGDALDKSDEELSQDDLVTISSLEVQVGTWWNAYNDWIDAANDALDQSIDDLTEFVRATHTHLRVMDRSLPKIKRDVAALEDDEIQSTFAALLPLQKRALRGMHRVTDAARESNLPALRRALRLLKRETTKLDQARRNVAAAAR